MNDYRSILLCVAGITPQIITEVLYALTQQRRERVDEVRVVTTLLGQKKLLECLLDPPDGKFFAFCRDYGIDPKSIKFDHTSITTVQTSDGQTLDDIRLKAENERTADRICEIVRELTKLDDVRIHASAAGGRKTMGIFLASAMQLFGRRQDALSHVLVNEPFENHPDFYYIPRQPAKLEVKDRQTGSISYVWTSEAHIELADIPFVRLRGLMQGWLDELPSSYGEIVQKTQEELDVQDAAQELRLACGKKTVALLNRKATLTEKQFFFYLLFARARKLGRGEAGFLRPAEITYEDLDGTFRLISITRGRKLERGIEDRQDFPRFDFLKGVIRDVEQQDLGSLQDDITEIVSKIKQPMEEAKLPEHCLITTKGHRGDLRYGLRISPERIYWS
jgi:CRISPR-associated protein (TIGR02584 family)